MKPAGLPGSPDARPSASADLAGQLTLVARGDAAAFDAVYDLDEAIEIASKHPTAWLGTIEVRPIAGNHCGDADLS